MSRTEKHPGSTHRKDGERQRQSGSPRHTVEKTGKRENGKTNGKAGSKNGGSHENSMNSARREARRRQRRKKQILRNVILVLLVLLIAAVVAGVGFLIKNGGKKASGSDKNNTGNVVTDASDQNDASADGTGTDGTDAEGNSSDEEDADASGDQTDNRKVKNTATEEHHKTNGLAICMYHYVYDEADPPEDLNNNFIEVHALEEEVKYLVDNDYYFPTWEEVKQYVEGDLLLPEKSVVLTFDDGARSFLDLGLPIFDKYQVPATSFLITANDGEEKVAEYQSDYVTFQSHSDNMHRGGGNIGHGGIFTAMSHDDAVADLQKSIEICGHGDAFAYPYGDYTEDCETAVKDAGFLCAVTTENRRAEVGDDPLLLPRVRMLMGQSLEGFISLVE